MKGRDIDFELKGVSLDPRLLRVLMRIGEDQSTMQQQLMQLATMLDAVMDNMTAFMAVAGNMKDKVDELQGQSAKDKISKMSPPEEG